MAPNVRVFEVPEAVQKKLLRYAPTTKPSWSPQLEFDTRQIKKDETKDTGAIKIVDILPYIIDKELNLFKQKRKYPYTSRLFRLLFKINPH